MRSTTIKATTMLGLLTCGAILAGCGSNTNGVEPTREVATVSEAAQPAISPEPLVAPVVAVQVDVATAKTAWKNGVVLFDNGDYTGAAVALKTAVAGEPTVPYRHYLLGLALWKSGDLETAETELNESAKLDATHVKTFINLARVRHDRGERAQALEAAERAIELDPTSADALHQKGRALMELGRKDEAIDALTTAHGLDADNGYIANTLGLLLIQTGKPGEAVPALEAAKLALPNVAYVRNNLAVAYERTGRLDEAKIEYVAAVDAGDAGGKAMKSLVRLGATDTTGRCEGAVVTASTDPR